MRYGIGAAWARRLVVGAFAGALPPLLGWIAATGSISHEALIIFGIQYYWVPAGGGEVFSLDPAQGARSQNQIGRAGLDRA